MEHPSRIFTWNWLVTRLMPASRLLYSWTCTLYILTQMYVPIIYIFYTLQLVLNYFMLCYMYRSCSLIHNYFASISQLFSFTYTRYFSLIISLLKIPFLHPYLFAQLPKPTGWLHGIRIIPIHYLTTLLLDSFMECIYSYNIHSEY